MSMFTVNKREKKKEEEEKLKCEMNQMMDDGCRVDDKMESHFFFVKRGPTEITESARCGLLVEPLNLLLHHLKVDISTQEERKTMATNW